MDVMLALRRLRGRVDAMVTRAVINRVNEGIKTARLQLTLLEDEVEDDVELMGSFGFHMSPPAGAEALAVAVGGARSHTVVVATGVPGERPTGLTEARTGGIYRLGQWVLFVDADGVVHVGAEVGAAFIARADRTDARLARLQAAFDQHVHTDPVSGSTAAPTAVPGVIPVGTLATVAATKGKVT